jgi:hypothetical protein
VRGQGVIGRNCAWCASPAVCEIEVQPAEYRTVTRVDPISGERTGHQAVVKAAVVVPACDEHRQITSGQPPPVGIPRQRRARGVEQLGLFVETTEARLRNAIHGDTRR